MSANGSQWAGRHVCHRQGLATASQRLTSIRRDGMGRQSQQWAEPSSDTQWNTHKQEQGAGGVCGGSGGLVDWSVRDSPSQSRARASKDGSGWRVLTVPRRSIGIPLLGVLIRMLRGCAFWEKNIHTPIGRSFRICLRDGLGCECICLQTSASLYLFLSYLSLSLII